MKNSTWIIIGLVMTIVILAAGHLKSSANSAQSKSFTVKKGASLEVSVMGGPVRVSMWDKNEVQVNAKVPNESGLSMTQQGEKVKVEYRSEKTAKAGQVMFEITVPANFDVKVKTLGGDIAFSDFTGRLDATSTGGNIVADRVAGVASFKATGGSIDLGSTNGDVTINSTGGKVTVGRSGKQVRTDAAAPGASGTIKVESTGGDVSLYLNPRGDSNIYAAGSHVSLYLPEAAKASVEARIKVKGEWESLSKKLAIRSDFNPENYVKDESQKQIRATYHLNGGGEVIRVETLTGNIEIRKF